MGSTPPAEPLQILDAEEFREHAHRVVDFVADYYRDVDVGKYPVRSQVEPGYLIKQLPESAPHNPDTLAEVLADVESMIVPGVTHWQSPSFFGYFPANSSTAGILAEILIAGFNTVGFSWIASPAATELEITVVSWLGKLLKLPESFISQGGGGVIQGSATEAMLVTLSAARKRAIEKHAVGSVTETDVVSRLKVYTSDQTHLCLQKACTIAGLKLIILATDKKTDYALSPDVLRKAIENGIGHGDIPLYLGATFGTTSSGAIDPLSSLGEIAKEYGMWFHVDAAYGGTACICPEYRHLMNGIELADSLNVGTHKWLLTNLDCSVMWVKNAKSLVSTLSVESEYLRNQVTETGDVVDFKDWQLSLGKRFRSLKLWLVMRLYGSIKLQEYIRHHVWLAKHFEHTILQDQRFEVPTPGRFGLVCFRLKVPHSIVHSIDMNHLNACLLDAVNSKGKTFLTHTILSGDLLLRMAIGASLTEMDNVDETCCIIQEEATKLLAVTMKSNV